MTKSISKINLKQIINFLISGIHKLLRICFFILIAGVIGVIYILYNTNPNEYKTPLTNFLSSKLNKEITIKGDLSWTIFSFKPSIKIEDLEIKNAPWGKNKNILTAKNIFASISIKDLLNKKFNINSIFIDSPYINLEENKDGIKNWKDKDEIITTNNLEVSKNTPLDLSIDIEKIIINNAVIKYYKFSKNPALSFNINKIDIKTDKTKKLPLWVTFTIKDNENFLKGQIQTYSIEDFLNNKKQITPLYGWLNLNNIKLNFNGNIYNINSNNTEIKLQTELYASNLQKSLKDFITLPPIDTINIKSDFNKKAGFINLNNINASYKSIELQGSSTITFNEQNKPIIKANLLIPFFDIPNIFYSSWEKNYFNRIANRLNRPKSNTPPIKNPKAFKNIPLPTTELDLANLNLNLKISKLKAMPEMQINNIDISALLHNQKAVVPINFDYMDGHTKVNVIAENKNNIFNGFLQIKGDNINLGKLIASTGYKNFMQGGNTNVDIILKGHGNNMENFMKTLQGYIKIFTTSKIKSFKIEDSLMATDLFSDFLKNLKIKKKSKPTTNINCLAVNLNITDGQTINKRAIAIETDKANIIIDGMVNLGRELLDTSIITITKEGLQLSTNITELLKIKGALAEPEFIINTSGLRDSITKTYIASVVTSLFTGGFSLLTIGAGYLTKSWLNNITENSHPCKVALNGGIITDKKFKNIKSNEDFKEEFETYFKETFNLLKTKL